MPFGIEGQIKTDEQYDAACKVIRSYIAETIKHSMEEMTGYKLSFVYGPELNFLFPAVRIHFWYNTKTNKVFVEYDFTKEIYMNIPLENVYKAINQKIEDNFHRDNNSWCEIVMKEDDFRGITDTSLKLTPFTIGYWRSLSGRYDFIVDETEVYHDADWFMNPSTIHDRERPPKKIEDFFEIVKNIRNKYDQTALTPAQTKEYIKEYNAIKISDPAYKSKINALNTKYNIKKSLNSSTPDMFKEYNREYEKFFERKLPEKSPDKYERTWYMSLQRYEKG